MFFDNSSFVGSLIIKFNNIANIEIVRDEHLIYVDVLDDVMTIRVDDLRPLHDYISTPNALVITKNNINPILEVVWDLLCSTSIESKVLSNFQNKLFLLWPFFG